MEDLVDMDTMAAAVIRHTLLEDAASALAALP